MAEKLGGNRAEIAECVKQTSDLGYIVAGLPIRATAI